MSGSFAVHAKAWTALAGSVLTLVGPWILQASLGLPAPWPAIVGAIFAVLTSVGVYRVPNQLTQKQVNDAVSKGHVPPPEYQSPWPKP